MISTNINFNQFNRLKQFSKLQKKDLKKIIISFFEYHHITFEYIDINFLNNDEMLIINQQYLNHNFDTDIITFDLSTYQNHIIADIYINLDMMDLNAQKFKQPIDNECVRLIIHGLLHLIGYNDKTPEHKKKMRQLENQFIKMFYTL